MAQTSRCPENMGFHINIYKPPNLGALVPLVLSIHFYEWFQTLRPNETGIQWVAYPASRPWGATAEGTTGPSSPPPEEAFVDIKVAGGDLLEGPGIYSDSICKYIYI